MKTLSVESSLTKETHDDPERTLSTIDDDGSIIKKKAVAEEKPPEPVKADPVNPLPKNKKRGFKRA